MLVRARVHLGAMHAQHGMGCSYLGIVCGVRQVCCRCHAQTHRHCSPGLNAFLHTFACTMLWVHLITHAGHAPLAVLGYCCGMCKLPTQFCRLLICAVAETEGGNLAPLPGTAPAAAAAGGSGSSSRPAPLNAGGAADDEQASQATEAATECCRAGEKDAWPGAKNTRCQRVPHQILWRRAVDPGAAAFLAIVRCIHKHNRQHAVAAHGHHMVFHCSTAACAG